MRVIGNMTRMALLVALSPNALERAAAQSRMQVASSGKQTPQQERATLVGKLKEFDQAQLVALVEERKLPGATSKWTIEQLRDVVTVMEGGGEAAVEEAGEVAETPSTFVLAYKPDGSSIEVHPGMDAEAWDAWTPPEEHEAVMVGSAEELAEVPTEVLLAVFNQAKGSKVKKFANPDTAREQAFASLAMIVDKANTTAASATAKETKKAAAKEPKTPKAPAEPKLINREPKAKDQIKQVGAGTKIDMLINLLAKKDGTTVEEIEATLSATGKPVKAAAWLGYDLNSVTGYGVRQDPTTKRLFIVYPKGMTAPLPTKEKKAPTPPKAKVAAAAPAETAEMEVEEVATEEEVAEAPAPAATKKAPAKAPAPAAAKPLTGIAKINAERAAAKQAAAPAKAPAKAAAAPAKAPAKKK